MPASAPPRRDIAALTELAAQLRVDSIRTTAGPSSGHVTSSLSAVDLMAVLLARIGAGLTVHTCLAAAAELAGLGIRARVIDLDSVKPVDRDALAEASRIIAGRFVTVEDHHVQGGIGSAVVEAWKLCGSETHSIGEEQE